jgi:hypothetical protein
MTSFLGEIFQSGQKEALRFVSVSSAGQRQNRIHMGQLDKLAANLRLDD